MGHPYRDVWVSTSHTMVGVWGRHAGVYGTPIQGCMGHKMVGVWGRHAGLYGSLIQGCMGHPYKAVWVRKSQKM